MDERILTLNGRVEGTGAKGAKIFERGKKNQKEQPISHSFLCPNRFGRCPLAKETWLTGKWTVDGKKKKKGGQSSYIAEQ